MRFILHDHRSLVLYDHRSHVLHDHRSLVLYDHRSQALGLWTHLDGATQAGKRDRAGIPTASTGG